jgi:hypothetical protein
MQKKLLDLICRYSKKNGKRIIIAMAIITIAFGIFIPMMKISSSQKDLIPKDHPDQKRYLKFQEEFGVSDNLIVVLEGDTDLIKDHADLFASEIEKEKKWVKSIFYKIDSSVLIKRAPLFFPLNDLKKAENMLLENNGMMQNIRNISGYYSLLEKLTQSLKNPDRDVNPESANKIILGLNSLVEEWNEWINDPKKEKLKLAEKLVGAGFHELVNLNSGGYLLSRNFKMLYLMIQPVSSSDDMTFLKPFVSNVRAACDRALKAHPDMQGKVKVAFTGMPAHVLTDTQIIHDDVYSGIVISIIIVSLILIFGFRSIKKTILAVIPTVCGLVISLGLITLVIGRLNLISSSMLAVLFGIGIDFGIYLIQRTEEELGNGLDLDRAIYTSVVLTSRSIITGGLTTSLAFLAIMLSKFVGYSELGLAAGMGLLVVMAVTFVMMPPLLYLIPVEPRNYHVSEFDSRAKAIVNRRLLNIAVIASVVITVGSVIGATQLKMDYNVLKLLPKDTESTIYQIKMEEHSDFKMSTAMITDTSLDHLKKVTSKVKNLKTVSRVDSLSELIPEDQDEKITIVKRFRPIIGTMDIKLVKSAKTADEYIMILDKIIPFFEDVQEKAFTGSPRLVESVEKLVENLHKTKKYFSGKDALTAVKRTSNFEDVLFFNISKAMKIVRESFEPERITEATFPEGIIKRFKSGNGTYAAFISPNGSIWDIDFLDKFVNDLKTISPNVTGFPVTHRVYVRQAVSAITESIIYSFVIILILLIIDFKRADEVILALVPLVIGMLWLQLALFIFRIDYNVANIAGLPLLLGLGIVYGLRIVHRWREDKSKTAFTATKTTGRGLAFAALAIVSGLFSIIFARHNGVSAFGIMLLAGIVICLLTALFILPVVIDMVYLLKRDKE